MFETLYKTLAPSGIVSRIAADIGNIHSLIELVLQQKGPGLRDAVQCVLNLEAFSRRTNIGSSRLLLSIGADVDSLCDDELQGSYLLSLARSFEVLPLPGTAEELLHKAISSFDSAHHLLGTSELCS